MNRFAIVGCEASGKTVLTASLADYFQPGASGRSCSMVPENVAAHRFFEYTQHQMRVKHAWPQATNPDKTTVMNWSLRIDNEVVADLQMLDFGGEVFRAAFREGEPTESSVAAQNELLTYLSEADFIVVTVGLDVLMRDMERMKDVSATTFARDSEAKWVTRGILDFVHKRLPPQTGVVVVLTQADAYYDKLDEMGGPDGLFMQSWPTVAALYPNVPVVAVSSVSDISEDGSPQEGYSSEGVLPLMSVFADYCVTGVDTVRESLTQLQALLRDAPEDTEPAIYREYIDKYEKKARLFRIASGLTGDLYNDELMQYVNVLVNMEGDVAQKLRRLEAAALARHKAEEERRKKAEEGARIAAEQKRKAEEEAERKRREEDAKKAEDERIKAEKDLEKSQLEAKVEREKVHATNMKSLTRFLVALLSALAVACVCGLAYFGYNTWQAASVEEMKVKETQHTALLEKVHKLSQAAQAGDLAAAQQILDLLERREIAEADVDSLRKVYMLLVNEGDARAMFRLGVACHEGTCGCTKSDYNAHWFLSMAQKAGYKDARLKTLLGETAASKDDRKKQSQGIDGLFVDPQPRTNAATKAEATAVAP